MLLVATGLLVSVFTIARGHWNAKVGLGAAALLLVQPLFLAQSTLLLPELPLALTCLWAMHAFFRQRYLLAGICLGLAIALKESALVLGVVLGVQLLVQWLRVRPSLKRALAGLLALLIPGLLYGLFLLVQKRQNGWYFYPLHERNVNFQWVAMKGKLGDYANFLFVEQGRFALTVVVGLWLLLRLCGRRAGERRFVHSLIGTFVLFGIGMLVFSAGNFFMKRYLLCLLPPLAILGSRALFELVREESRVLAPAVAGLGLLSLAELTSPGFNYDYDMSFRASVLLQRQATRYVEDTLGFDKPILTIFPPIFGLEDPRYGYSRAKFKRFSFLYFPEAEYIFVSEVFNRYTPPAGVRVELMKRFSSPYINFFLYRILR
jgi:4-amino-4-deoxy-L-arabinose transferase-like glycosyltransferase